MSLSYSTLLWSIDIKPKLDSTSEEWIFFCEDLKTGKEYEQQYELSEITEKYKILALYPNIFQSLLKCKMPNIRFNDNNAIISWEIDIPFNDKEIITLNINIKSKEGLTEEFIELQQSNKLLIRKVKSLENEIVSIKSLFSRLYGNSMHDRLEILKARVECGYDVNNDPRLDENVKNILLSHELLHKSIDDVNLFESSDLNYLRELIKYGYSVTNPTLDNCGHYVLQSYSNCKISPLVYYIAFNVAGSELPSEKHLLLFKTIIELIIPNANLKRKYDKIGSIIQWLTNQSSETVTYCSHFTSQTNEAIKKNIKMHIKFLTDMGF